MVLSICIPSYNRFDELKKLLCSISKAKSDEFEVVVVDNGSSDDIDFIKTNDDRIRIIKREQTVPGPISCRTVLDYGNGKYCMLCLDKDYILGEYLDLFIEELKRNIGIPCGYCVLNSEMESGQFKIHKDITKSIYRCGHPSGYFFRRDIIEKDGNFINHLNKNGIYYNNPFLLDILYAYGVTEGSEAIYNGRLVIPEKPEKCSNVKSYTYSKKNNNLYFMPEQRRKQLFIFLEHLESLNNIEDSCKVKIIDNLYRKTMYACTLGFRKIMSNKQLCNHHSIECKKINVRDMVREENTLSSIFFNKSIKNYKMFHKCKIIVFSKVYIWIKIIHCLLGGKR